MLVDVDPMGFGTEAECLDALTRRFASTNVCMTMDYPTEKHVVDLVGDFVHVSPERKKALVEEWQMGKMGNGAPLHCCGSCGIRDWELNYHRLLLSELSPLFQLDEDSLKRLYALKKYPVQLIGARTETRDGQEKVVYYELPSATDLTPIMSHFETKEGRFYHLHQELVDPADESVVPCDE